LSVDGLRFVITGGASGIGAATARLAAQRGGLVTVADIDETGGREPVEAIRGSGGAAWFVRCDVTVEADLVDGINQAASEMGGIDVLHNNAGVADKNLGDGAEISLETFSREVWDRVLAVNLTAPMFAAKAALPHLRQSSNPSIINAGSVGSFVAYPSLLAYGSSKGALATLTKNLAVELAPDGIRVNCYCPATIATPMADRPYDVDDPGALRQSINGAILVNRIGRPEEVAALVMYLASDESRFVNGVTWLIDGGALAWRNTVDILGMSPGEAAS